MLCQRAMCYIPLGMLLFFSLAACASVEVQSAKRNLNLKTVCIEENKQVVVEDFLPVLIKGFERHGIQLVVSGAEEPGTCDAVLMYTARQSWDIVPYLASAELNLYKNAQMVASAKYQFNGRGFLPKPHKWKSVQSKMNPVIDKLLKEYR